MLPIPTFANRSCIHIQIPVYRDYADTYSTQRHYSSAALTAKGLLFSVQSCATYISKNLFLGVIQAVDGTGKQNNAGK